MKVEVPGIKYIINNLDIIAGTIGIFLGIFIIYLYYAIHLQQQDIGFVILAASSIYLLLKNKFKKTSYSLPKINHREKLVLNILFFCIFSITLLIWYFQLYQRPLIYFILISFLTGIIAIEILYFKEGDSVWPVILKIFLISVNIRAGIFYNFPSIMGYDAYWHAKIAELITNTGFVPPIEISHNYFYYPIFHIFLSIPQIVYQTDIKDAIFYSIGIISIFSTIFIYIIVNKIAGPQAGLLATLLANITNFSIIAGIANITPGSIVLLYFMLILYLLFKEEHKFINTSLILFITFLMIITHQLSTFVVFISLTSIYFGKHLYKVIYNGRADAGITYILLFAVGLQSYWMNTYVTPSASFFDSVVGPLIHVLQSGGEYGSNVLIVGYEYQRTLLDTLLLHSSYLILPLFAIGGVLLWLSLRDDKKFSIVIAVVILYLFIYGIPLMGMRNMLTDRWQPFLIVFLVMLASTYALKIIQSIKLNPSRIFAVFIIVFVFSFIMITTPGINKDNPIAAKDTTIRNQFKYSEIYAARMINNVSPEGIRIDSQFSTGFIFYGTNASSYFNILHESNIFGFNMDYINSVIREEKGTMIILRKSTLNEPISVSDPKLYGVSKALLISKEFFDKFDTYYYNLIYNNGDVLVQISI